MAPPELPDDRRAHPRRYAATDQQPSARPQGATAAPAGVWSAPPVNGAARLPGTPWPAEPGVRPAPPAAGYVQAGPGAPPPHGQAPSRGVRGAYASRAIERRPADPHLDDPTDVYGRVPAEPPVEDGELPGRHRRRAGASPDERPAAEYRGTAPSGRKPRTGRRRRPTFWKELPLLVVVALLLTFLIQTFLAKVYVIPSGSMELTLHGCTGCNNDRVLVDKVSFRFADPQPGDVVVFRGPDSWSSEVTYAPPSNALAQGLQQVGSLIGLAPPDEKDFVKRVIAVGGQTVQCCDSRNRVLVDGEPLEEDEYVYYLPEAGEARQSPFGPITIPPGELWMMGDSRNNSADSRVPGHGPVPVGNVIGKARLIVLPFPRFGLIDSDNPQTTTVALAAPDSADGAPLALGLVGVWPLLVWRRRVLRRETDAFLPLLDRRRLLEGVPPVRARR